MESNAISTLNNFVNIPVIDTHAHFWMIRTKQGIFYDEFVSNEYIAIGWNYLNQNNLKNLSKETNARLKDIIAKTYKEKMPQTPINKCKRFVYEIQTGDYIVIVGSENITFAIVGDYYEESGDSFSVDHELSVTEDIEKKRIKNCICPYSKRRKIVTIKEIPKGALSPYLINNIIANHHSLSSLDDEPDLVLSSCYDAYIRGNNLLCVFRVQKRSKINMLDFSAFIQETYKYMAEIMDEPPQMSIQIALHSPGDITLTCLEYGKHIIGAILVYFAIFGGKFGNYEFPSLLKVIEKALLWKDEKDNRKLDIDIKKEDLESKQLDNELKRLEIYEKKQELLEATAKRIGQSSAALEIKEVDSKIIDFYQVLDTEDKPGENK